MFTGIVEETGVVERIKKGRNSAELTVKASYIMVDVKLGDSIAVWKVIRAACFLHR